jgi:hypothetical protein
MAHNSKFQLPNSNFQPPAHRDRWLAGMIVVPISVIATPISMIAAPISMIAVPISMIVVQT